MSQILQYLPMPWALVDEGNLFNAASNILATNVVYLFAFEVNSLWVVTNGRWQMGPTTTGTTDFGIYDVNGNLLIHTGVITNVASAIMSPALAINLGPGKYMLGMCPSNNTDTYLRSGISGTRTTLGRYRQASNSGVAGVLPATTGGFANNAVNQPLMALVLAGGLN